MAINYFCKNLYEKCLKFSESKIYFVLENSWYSQNLRRHFFKSWIAHVFSKLFFYFLLKNEAKTLFFK